MTQVTDEIAAEIMVLTKGQMPHMVEDAEYVHVHDRLVALGQNITAENYDAALLKAQETYRLLTGEL